MSSLRIVSSRHNLLKSTSSIRCRVRKIPRAGVHSYGESPSMVGTANPQQQHQKQKQQQYNNHNDLSKSPFHVPRIGVPMSHEEIQVAKDQIWYNISRNTRANAPDKALQVFERLLDQEQSVLEAGIVINVLRNCSKRGMKYDQSLGRLDRICSKLRYKQELWEESIPSFILSAMAKSMSPNSPQYAENFLKGMIQKHKQLPRQNQSPNPIHYTSVLNSYAKRGMASEAEQLLQYIQSEHKAGNLQEGPGSAAYNCVINAVAQSNDPDAPQKAGAFVEYMEKGHAEIQPNAVTYGSELKCYAKRGQSIKAEQLLQRIDHRQKSGESAVRPNTHMYNMVMDAFAKSNDRDSPQRAERLLQSMIHLYSSGNKLLQPDQRTGNCLLNCYARHGMTTKAYQFLQLMHKLYQKGIFKEGPNTYDYNTIMNLLSKRNTADSVQKGEELLNLMVEMCEAGSHRIQPDLVTFSSLLNIYARNGTPQKAMELLEKIHELHNEKVISGGPNTTCYNIVLNALANSSDPNALEAAQRLIYRMELFAVDLPNLRPDQITFNTLLKCCENAKDFEAAGKVIEKMQDLHDKGELEGGPDRISFKSLIFAHFNSNDPNTILNAEALLDQIPEPHVGMYAALLHEYAENAMASEAEKLVQQMHDMHKAGKLKSGPNLSAYESVLKAIVRSKKWDAPERARKILNDMIELVSNGYPDLHPTVTHYNQVLDTYQQEGMLRESLELLLQMYDLHEKGDLPDGPDMASFSCVMELLAQKGGKDAPKRAEILLKKMLHLFTSGNKNVQPDADIRKSFLECFEKNGKLTEGVEMLQKIMTLRGKLLLVKAV